MKKRDALVNMEKDSFNRNMAQMAAMPAGAQIADTNDKALHSTGKSGYKWAALRTFLKKTTVQKSDAYPAPANG